MLLASGVNYGFVRSLPHVLGISIGFGVMVVGVGAGLGRLFEDYPSLYAALRIVGGAYLLYRPADRDGRADAGRPNGRPFGFWKAAGFQWVNPKAWIMAIGAITAYLPTGGGMQAVVLLALLFALVNAPSVTVWVTFGTALRRWLTDLRHLRVFNVSMAIMLVLSLYPLLFDDLPP